MTGIEELRERVSQAEQRFGVLDEQDAKYSERLIALMNAIEGRFREQRSEIEQQAEEIGRQGKELAGLSGRLNRTAEENEQLRGMLLSLLTAIEGGRHDGLAETMHNLDRTVSALLQGAPQAADLPEVPSGPVEDSAEGAQADDGPEAAEPASLVGATESEPAEAVGLDSDEAFDTGAEDEMGATDDTGTADDMGAADDTGAADDMGAADEMGEVPAEAVGLDPDEAFDADAADEEAAPAAPLFMGPEDLDEVEDIGSAPEMDDEPALEAPVTAAAEIGAAVSAQDVAAAVEIDEVAEASEAAETAEADAAAGRPIFAQGSAAEPSVADEDVAEPSVADEAIAEVTGGEETGGEEADIAEMATDETVAEEAVSEEAGAEETAPGAAPGPDASQPCTLDEIMRRVSRLVEEADAAGLPAAAEDTASEGAEGAVSEGGEGAASEAEETLGRTATGS